MGSGDYVGGLFGRLTGKSIDATDLTNEGDVTGANYVGGLFGSFYTNNYSYVTKPVSTGTVTGVDHTGELFGEMSNCTIKEE